MKPTRLKWKPFIETKAYTLMQWALRCFGYALIVKFDENGNASDVYVISLWSASAPDVAAVAAEETVLLK